MHPFRHLKTILKHRHLVMNHCFRVGLVRRGLLHDLSKFSPAEFCAGARYYAGSHSPTVEERKQRGYSAAWLHHKGRNRHHFEYWNDVNPETHRYEPVPMPAEFFAEMVMDRIAAAKVYLGKDYTDAAPLQYLERVGHNPRMHPDTYRKLVFVLNMLKEEGEEATFRFIREEILGRRKSGRGNGVS